MFFNNKTKKELNESFDLAVTKEELPEDSKPKLSLRAVLHTEFEQSIEISPNDTLRLEGVFPEHFQSFSWYKAGKKIDAKTPYWDLMAYDQQASGVYYLFGRSPEGGLCCVKFNVTVKEGLKEL